MPRELFAEIISTGSEMMLGRLVDTNSAWLSDILNSSGIKVVRHTAVGDDFSRIVRAFKDAWADHNIIISTGGLGPTEDDLTRQAAAEAFGLELEYHEELAEELRQMFARHNYVFTENNMRQAWLPKGGLVIPNPNGTAPGFALCDENHLMAFLPGVPVEMKHMATAWFLPRLRETFPIEKGLSKTVILKTAGLGESNLDSIIGDLVSAQNANPEVGMLAAPDMVRVLVTARGASEAELDAVLAPTLAELEKRLMGHVFGYGDTTLPEAVAELLAQNNLSLFIVDSATQGRLSGSLSPVIGPQNWSGAKDLPNFWVGEPVREVFGVFGPKVFPLHQGMTPARLVVRSHADPDAPPLQGGQIALVIESLVQSDALNNGEPVIKQFKVGGAKNRALSRAAALSIFHLWQILSPMAQNAKIAE